MKAFCTVFYVKGTALLEKYSTPALFLVGIALLFGGTADGAFAQTGDTVFKNAACNLLDEVLTQEFGAMLTAITGALAIVAAAAGSFKGAWALIFVSVGCFISPHLIKTLFPDLACGGMN